MFEAIPKYWQYKKNVSNKPSRHVRLRRWVFRHIFRRRDHPNDNEDQRSLQARLWHRVFGRQRGDINEIQFVLAGLLHALSIIVFNLIAAGVVHNTRGYQHVSIIRLAVLFCARPRMEWMASLLILLDHEIFVNAALSMAVAEYYFNGLVSIALPLQPTLAGSATSTQSLT